MQIVRQLDRQFKFSYLIVVMFMFFTRMPLGAGTTAVSPHTAPCVPLLGSVTQDPGCALATIQVCSYIASQYVMSILHTFHYNDAITLHYTILHMSLVLMSCCVIPTIQALDGASTAPSASTMRCPPPWTASLCGRTWLTAALTHTGVLFTAPHYITSHCT